MSLLRLRNRLRGRGEGDSDGGSGREAVPGLEETEDQRRSHPPNRLAERQLSPPLDRNRRSRRARGGGAIDLQTGYRSVATRRLDAACGDRAAEQRDRGKGDTRAPAPRTARARGA